MTHHFWKDDFVNKVSFGDCSDLVKNIPDSSVASIIEDPPYGVSFMNRDWDKAIPSVSVFKEAYRVLKTDGILYTFSLPRLDCLTRMVMNISTAGFIIDPVPFYWTFANGNIPKSQNISKSIDKRECMKMVTSELGRKPTRKEFNDAWSKFRDIYWKPIAYQDSECWGIPNRNSDGSYEATSYNIRPENITRKGMRKGTLPRTPDAIRFNGSYGGFQLKPAVEVIIKASKITVVDLKMKEDVRKERLPDDVKMTLPFLVVPKASRKERNAIINREKEIKTQNDHETVKPIKLMEYLVLIGSDVGDIVMDFYGGSGTTALACIKKGRNFILFENDPSSVKISRERIGGHKNLFEFV